MELRTNRTQQGAGAPGRRVRPSTPASPSILPRAPGSPGLRGAGSQPTSARPGAHSRSHLSTPGGSAHDPRLPSPSRELSRQGGAGRVGCQSPLCSIAAGRSPDSGDFVPDMPCLRSKSLVTLLPRPFDPEGLDHVPRPDQGSDGRKPDSWLGKMSVVQESQRAGEGISGSGKNSVCQGAAKGPGGFDEGPSRRGRGVRWLAPWALQPGCPGPYPRAAFY